MARKAARGAGYAWGMADEAGFATRWLEARGQGGIAALAGHLEDVASSDPAVFAPKNATDWTTISGRLCPILTGAAFADAALMMDVKRLTVPEVAAPRLLLPFLAHVASVKGRALRIESCDSQASVFGDALALSGPWDTCSIITVTPETHQPETLSLATRAMPDPIHWRILNRYASRTYAPATEASRLKGAGAGLTDND